MRNKNKNKKKRRWPIIVIILLAIGLIGSMSGEEDDSNTNNQSKTEEKTSKKEESKKEEDEKEDKMTIGQRNAYRKAKNYLSFSAFSKSGLIEQLEFEGYSNEDATYAVDNCDVDWKNQATLKADDHIQQLII